MSERPTTKHDIQRDELNITRPNFSEVTQIDVTGSASMVWTGRDRGTGLVLISVSGTSYPLSSLLGGTGITNSGTFTNQSNTTIKGGGTINLQGYGLTVPASGTAALIDVNQIFTASHEFDNRLGFGIAPNSAAWMFGSWTETGTAGTFYGQNIGMYTAPIGSGTSSASIVGAQLTARTEISNPYTFSGSLIGAYYNTYHRGTSTLAAAYDLQTANLAQYGTITDAVGLKMLGASLFNGAAITNLYGIYINNMTAGSVLNYAIYTNLGNVHFGDDVDLASGKNLTILAASIITDTTTGLKIGTATTQKLGFFNATPIVRGTAFTQTYSTAATTITQTTMTDPAAYGAGTNGYSTAAMAQAIHAEVIALRANMIVTQNVLNGVIDQLQALGLFG